VVVLGKWKTPCLKRERQNIHALKRITKNSFVAMKVILGIIFQISHRVADARFQLSAKYILGMEK